MFEVINPTSSQKLIWAYVHSTIRLIKKFRKCQEMCQVLSFTDAVAKSPPQVVIAASSAFSADGIILVMKVGIVFIIIITVAFSIWRSFSSASPNGGHLVSSSPAGTVDSAGMKTIHQLHASLLPLLVVFDFTVPSKTKIAFETGNIWINLLPLLVNSRICRTKHWMGKVLSCLIPSSSTLQNCDVGRWSIFKFKVALWEEF